MLRGIIERAAYVHNMCAHTHTHTPKQTLYVNKGNFFITKEMSAAEVMDATSPFVCVGVCLSPWVTRVCRALWRKLLRIMATTDQFL